MPENVFLVPHIAGRLRLNSITWEPNNAAAIQPNDMTQLRLLIENQDRQIREVHHRLRRRSRGRTRSRSRLHSRSRSRSRSQRRRRTRSRSRRTRSRGGQYRSRSNSRRH